MSLRWSTPCDEPDPMTGRHICPYANGGDYVDCEYWCGAEEPEDDPEDWPIIEIEESEEN